MDVEYLRGASPEASNFLQLAQPYGSDMVGDPTVQFTEEQEERLKRNQGLPSKWNFGRFY